MSLPCHPSARSPPRSPSLCVALGIAGGRDAAFGLASFLFKMPISGLADVLGQTCLPLCSLNPSRWFDSVGTRVGRLSPRFSPAQSPRASGARTLVTSLPRAPSLSGLGPASPAVSPRNGEFGVSARLSERKAPPAVSGCQGPRAVFLTARDDTGTSARRPGSGPPLPATSCGGQLDCIPSVHSVRVFTVAFPSPEVWVR